MLNPCLNDSQNPGFCSAWQGIGRVESFQSAVGIICGWVDLRAEGGGGKGGAGMVVAAGHDGEVFLGGWAAGDGALYAGDAGGEPDGPETRTCAPVVARKAARYRGQGRRQIKMCHNSRTAPFIKRHVLCE